MALERSCIFIDNDPYHQAIFIKALSDVSPDTICFTATNAVDALYMLVHEHIRPAYIFIELDLPQMNAVEFLKTVKELDELNKIPVIVHSTGIKPYQVIELKKAGAWAICFRPYEYYHVCNMLSLYFGSQLGILQQN